MNKRCIEGYWLGGYYMPSGLYFYTHMGTIQLTEEDSNVKSLSRPKLRDIELNFFPNFLIARGFSGFELDEEYSSHRILLEPNITDEYLKKKHPSTINSSGNRKQFIPPLSNLTMQHPYHKGRALFYNEAYNLMLMGARNFGKALHNDELLITQDSFKRIGDAVVGDKIYGRDGKLTTIVGVHPQGKVDLLEFTFRDGRVVRCCKEHL